MNPASGINPEHLNYFKFIGRCLGLSIFHRRFLDAYFIAVFYKMMLKKKITLDDLETVDALGSQVEWWCGSPGGKAIVAISCPSHVTLQPRKISAQNEWSSSELILDRFYKCDLSIQRSRTSERSDEG